MFQRSLQPEPYQNDRDMLAARVHHSQHLTRQMATVLGLTKVLNSRHKLEQQLTVILNETNRILDADFSVFYLLNERRKELWPHFLWDGRLRQIRQPVGNSIADYVIEHGKVVNVADAYNHPQYQTQIAKLGQVPIRSFLIVPICNRSGKISGCLQVINKQRGPFDQKDTQCLMIIADLIAIAIQNNLLWNQAEECKRLESEITRAVDIQRQLLPGKLPQLPGYEMFAFNQPSKYVGGDYYDFFPFPRTMSMVLADVSGKGVPAALLTANLHASLHAHASEINSCKEIVKKINNHFYLYTASDMFATFFWANLNHDTHRFKYVNAGHIPPLLVKKDGTVSKLKSGGLPIGIVDSFEYEQSELKLSRGDTLLLFTDGITEIVNQNNEQFGKRRLSEIVQRHYHLPPRELGKMLINQVRLFAKSPNYPDDMTLMIIKRN
ncbi:MAG: SpoIIE family protein phosphatase [Calditrichaeota bacterium]|nr:SpoIIE family protein phosphatase [Calditrichota bacterium]MCB0306098.1 SpoIIE family protein phosphatase [Calditrichota bacterium]